MKNIKTALFGTIIGLLSLNTYAQGPTLPAPSPAASVSQVFGLTKVEINYSSPAVKGRQIWGGLVPYDSVWRTGANQATNINFSTDVMIDGTTIKKGKYALFTVPGRNSWTIILNTDAEQFGAFNYKKSLDVARFTAMPQAGDMKEHMAFMIDPTSDTTATVTLCWEKLKVSFSIWAQTKTMIAKNIDNYTSGIWRNYANAANYYLNNNLDLTKAHDWAMQSVQMQESFYNRYILAKVLQAQDKDEEALKYANEAKTIGDKNPDGFYNEYKDDVAKLINTLSTSVLSGKKKKK